MKYLLFLFPMICVLYGSATMVGAVSQNSFTIVREITQRRSENEIGKTVSKVLPAQDLNADGKVEKVIVSTYFGGGSLDGHTLKVFSASGKFLAKISYNSFGGCAIGSLFPAKKTKQLIVWNARIAEDECNMEPHYYGTFVYDWTSSGKLVESDRYTTSRKYDIGSRQPLDEYLRFRRESPELIGLPGPISLVDSKAILLLAKKSSWWAAHGQNTYEERSLTQLGNWVALDFEDSRGSDRDFLTIWHKKNGRWQCLVARYHGPGGGPDSKFLAGTGISRKVMEKLIGYYYEQY